MSFRILLPLVLVVIADGINGEPYNSTCSNKTDCEKQALLFQRSPNDILLLGVLNLSRSTPNRRKLSQVIKPDAGTPGLVTTPVNTTVHKGEDAIFKCSAANGSYARIQWWEWASSGITQPQMISDRQMLVEPWLGRYEIETPSSDAYYLLVRGVRFSDAGRYTCVNAIGGPPYGTENTANRASAYLTVIDLVPDVGLVITPINTVVYKGGEAIFRCSGVIGSKARIQWWEWASSGDTLPQIISDRELLVDHPLVGRYEIQSYSNDTYNLVVSDVHLSDAGRYTCVDAIGGPPYGTKKTANRVSVYLTVIDGKPECDTTIPSDGKALLGDSFSAACLIRYRGKFEPTITWNTPSSHTTDENSGDGFVWSEIKFDVIKKMQNKSYIAVLDVDNTWKYKYTTPVLDVYWSPKLYFVPDKDFYIIGDVIECLADARPSPSFSLFNVRTGEYLPNTNNFTLTESMNGKTQKLKCQAENTLVGTTYRKSVVLYKEIYVVGCVDIYVPAARNTVFGGQPADCWITIHQKLDDFTDFDLNWTDYKAGFGTPGENFWIGLERMHQMTSTTSFKLRIEVQSRLNHLWYFAEYATFLIDSEADGYAIHVTGYHGNAGDSLQTTTEYRYQCDHNGRKFSTRDVDNDLVADTSCATNTGGGSWYSNCGCFRLTCQSFLNIWFTLYYERGLPTAGLNASRMLIHKT